MYFWICLIVVPLYKYVTQFHKVFIFIFFYVFVLVSSPVMTDEQKARLSTKRPLTKEEYEARQSVIRRVVDPETGRTRYGISTTVVQQ